MELLVVWGLGFFGILLYAVVQVWKKVKSEEFSLKKFFGDNKMFWGVCIVLSLLLSIGIVFVDGFKDVLHNIGFAVEDDNNAAFVLLGIALAIGSDKTVMTGSKKLNKPN